MALFLFLVCAALASVILTASTAAAGRSAGLGEADQRYYGVTSAAGLVRDIMDGSENASVQIVCTKTTTFTRVGNTMTEDPDPQYTLAVNCVGATPAFFQKLAEQIITAQAGSSPSDAWDWQLGTSSGSDVATSAMQLSYTINGGDAEAQAALNQVSVTEKLKSNGDLVMTFSAGEAESANAVDLLCEATGETQNQTTTQTNGSTVKRIETKVTKISWKATSLKPSTAGGGSL